MIFKQETIKSWFTGVGSSINNEMVQPFQNANSIISKYNLAIQHNSLTQQEWQRLLAQSDDSLKAYLTSIKGATASMSGYNVSLQGNITGFTKITKAMQQYNALGTTSQKEQQAFASAVGVTNSKLGTYLAGLNGAKASIGGYIKYLVAAEGASIGLQAASIALNAAISMGISFAISALVSQISKWIHAQEEARQKAIDLTNSYKEQRDSLNDQIEKYKELKETLDKGNLSTDETRSIKEQLLEIQKSLIESYGDEASNIDLVNGKYREQLGLLSELSKEKATDYVIENRDVFVDAKEALEKTRTYNLGTVASWNAYAPKTEDQKKLIEYLETYSDLLDLTYSGPNGYGVGSVNLSVKADVESADKIMHQLAEDLERYGKDNNIDVSGLLKGISGQLKKTWTDELTEYKTVYDEFMKAEIVRNDTLRPLYQQSIQAVEDYNNALSSGEGVEEAKANLDSVQQAVQNATGGLEGSQEIFDGIYDGINKNAESAYNLAQSFENDESVKEYAEQLKGLTDIDLQAINFEDNIQNPGEEAFSALIDILGLSEEEVQNLIDKLVELGYVQGEVQDSTSNIENPISDFSSDVDSLLSSISSVNEVLSSTSPGFSISYEDFNSEELKDYRDALEYVNGTMQLNAEKVKEIVQAKADEKIAIINNNKALEQTKYLENAKQIEKYREKLRNANYAEGESAESVQELIDALLLENGTIADTCAQYDLLSHSIKEAVGSYQNWLNAQSASDYGDMATDAVSAIQRIRDTYDQNSDIFGDYGSKKFEAAVDFIVPDSVDDEDLNAIETYMANFKQYLTFDDDGAVEGLNIDKFLEKSVEAGLMSYSDNDGFKVLGGKKMEDFAEGLNMSSGMVQAFFDELQLKGAEFDWSDEAVKTIGDLAIEANEAAEALRGIEGNENLSIKMDVSDLATTDEQLSALDATISEMDGIKTKFGVDSSEAEHANAIIQYCLIQKQLLSQPDVMRVDTSQVEGDIGKALSLLQEFQNAQNDLEIKSKVGADTSEAETKVNSLAAEIQGLSPEIKAILNLNTNSVESIQTSINELTAGDLEVKAHVNADAITGYHPESKSCEVIYNPNTDALPKSFKPIHRDVIYKADTSGLISSFPTLTQNVRLETTSASVSGKHESNGTAHVGGTARAGGDWGTAPGGKTLVGELGEFHAHLHSDMYV